MGRWGALAGIEVLKWSVLNIHTVGTHLKRIDQMTGHGGDVEGFMEEQDVCPECDGTIIGHSNSRYGCACPGAQ